MKKFWKSLMLVALGVFALSSCEDVPAPYAIPTGGGSQGTTSVMYSSASCSDWTMLAGTSGNNPWSQGASYTQATGYQKWDGADSKSNRMADGYLISPDFSTVTDSASAYVSFQYCVAYASNDAQFADHIKAYISSDYDATDGFVAEKWTQLDWTATHTSTNWELETTTITLPAEFMNKEKVNIAFYFTTPNDTKSSTFEIKEFKVVAGTPGASEGEEEIDAIEVSCAEAAELTNALADGGTSDEVYAVTGYITEVVGSPSNNQQTFWMDDTKDGAKAFEAYWANLPEGVTAFTVGSKVKIIGKLTKYVKDGKVTPEIKNATVVILEEGEGGTTEGIEVTCAQAAELTNALADGGTSDETYTVIGYITEIMGNVSRNQQSFWMADTKDGGKVFEAYYANLPEGVSEFVVGSKVKITGKLMKYVKDGKVTPEIKNATVEILETGEGGGGGTTEGTEVTCAQAVELTNALADGASSTESYTVTGYITEVFGNVNRNQQSFWMADTKGGENMFEAYWANLPEGVSEFVVGSKVKITGNLMKYVKDGKVTPEIKNATVEILEVGEGGGDNTGGGDDNTGSSEGISVNGTTITLTNPNMTAGSNSVTLDLSTLGYTNAQDLNDVVINAGDTHVAFTVVFSKASGSTTPKYYDGTKGVRMYANNTLTITGTDSNIAKIVLECDAYSGTNHVGNETKTVSFDGPTAVLTNTYSTNSGGVQLRVKTITVTFAQ